MLLGQREFKNFRRSNRIFVKAWKRGKSGMGRKAFKDDDVGLFWENP